jgi:LacI family transcriptional regulator
VSRVINNTGYISETTRKRVQAAIKKLGYVPNSLARSLRSRRTGILALVLSDITNPFFTSMARGVEDTANDAGFSVIFCNTDESEAKEEEYVHLSLQKQVDGVLLVPARSACRSIKLIQAQRTPLVVIDRRVEGITVDTVRCDSEDGAYRLVQVLIKLGHRRIAVLAGPDGVSTAADRIAGYKRALAEVETPAPEPLIYSGAFTYASGVDMTRQALTAQPQPTAIFAANNFIAMGALRTLQEAGIRVPEDMALVSFDDLPTPMVISPFLTVVAQPAYELGRVATNRLLAQLAGSKAPKDTMLPLQLIVRSSSGGPIAP